MATGSAPAHVCDIPDPRSQPSGVADDGPIQGGRGFVCVVLALEVRRAYAIQFWWVPWEAVFARFPKGRYRRVMLMDP